MKTILICNQKGGVGKTLIAEELAFMFEADGVKISIYDLDQQGGLIHETKEDPDAAVAIVDTPGALQGEMRKWIEDADLVIIPTLMSNRDAAPLERMIQIVKAAKKDTSKVLFVFNKWNNNFTIAKDFSKWFSIRYPEFQTAVLCESTAFNMASACGESIQTYNSRCKGAKQMRELYGFVKTNLGIKEGWRE